MDHAAFRQVLVELNGLQAQAGLSLMELIELSDEAPVSAELRAVLSWLVRANRFFAADLAEYLGQNRARAHQLLHILENRGFLAAERVGRRKQYHVVMQLARHTRPLKEQRATGRRSEDLWKLFE